MSFDPIQTTSSPNPSPPPAAVISNNISYKERVHYYKEALKPNVIDISIIQHLAEQGIPESHGLRSLYWKILLRYLPLDRTKWDSFLEKSRGGYKGFVDELMIDPHDLGERPPEADHPLSVSVDSKWNEYFKDQNILVDIEKDVRRTFPSLHFFNHQQEEGKTIHYEALRRILFIYAKLNPGIRYVQGMNEILGPIYYIFAIDPDENYKQHAEADAFYCFTNIMSEIRDNFCKSLDKSESGIIFNIKKLNRILKEKDRELWNDLEEKKLNPQFYSFRWITLLLSQEFELPDVLRLWDSLFSDPNRFDFLYYFCCSMLICVRDQLLSFTFADSLKLLQSYPAHIDFHTIYATALSLKNGTFKLNSANVLESGQSYIRFFNPFSLGSYGSSNSSNSNNNTLNSTSPTTTTAAAATSSPSPSTSSPNVHKTTDSVSPPPSNNNVNNPSNSNSPNLNSMNDQSTSSSTSTPPLIKGFFAKYFDSNGNAKQKY
ncbi:hypothetical protein CYY_002740 [Polysphondylium violaceum]|uniref:TBC1 domain family member 13 n=1 Tax=Polysphondylium violaceum TaxID=133409 RepID=A0A8J4PZN9_9MYCE|nr:hypothetical protein CYY_002740 [Polysphondylium violaceum]